ncbi:MAG: flagellar motor stator protein MotA [Gammaproteobacteria bacterium]|nr:flagellar motor stator protein MotA [Gammaproteobacteria bacterium]
MLVIVGAIVVIAAVLAGYVLAHGHLIALWQPYEVLIICGAALGAFLAANPMPVVKRAFSGLLGILKGSPYNQAAYLELFSFFFDIFSKARKEGMMAIENDVEEPEESEIFKQYPAILGNHHAVEFITDYLRLVVGGNMNPMELENLMDIELETHHHEAEAGASAITAIGDGLPGFGIVAAVLGIVITMGSLGGPVEEIGAHVAAALVGTFLGILFAYGFVNPWATAMGHVNSAEAKFLECIKVCIMAQVNGYAPQIAIEFGRKTLYSTERPSFAELEEHVKNKDK